MTINAAANPRDPNKQYEYTDANSPQYTSQYRDSTVIAAPKKGLYDAQGRRNNQYENPLRASANEALDSLRDPNYWNRRSEFERPATRHASFNELQQFAPPSISEFEANSRIMQAGWDAEKAHYNTPRSRARAEMMAAQARQTERANIDALRNSRSDYMMKAYQGVTGEQDNAMRNTAAENIATSRDRAQILSQDEQGGSYAYQAMMQNARERAANQTLASANLANTLANMPDQSRDAYVPIPYFPTNTGGVEAGEVPRVETRRGNSLTGSDLPDYNLTRDIFGYAEGGVVRPTARYYGGGQVQEPVRYAGGDEVRGPNWGEGSGGVRGGIQGPDLVKAGSIEDSMRLLSRDGSYVPATSESAPASTSSNVSAPLPVETVRPNIISAADVVAQRGMGAAPVRPFSTARGPEVTSIENEIRRLRDKAANTGSQTEADYSSRRAAGMENTLQELMGSALARAGLPLAKDENGQFVDPRVTAVAQRMEEYMKKTGGTPEDVRNAALAARSYYDTYAPNESGAPRSRGYHRIGSDTAVPVSFGSRMIKEQPQQAASKLGRLRDTLGKMIFNPDTGQHFNWDFPGNVFQEASEGNKGYLMADDYGTHIQYLDPAEADYYARNTIATKDLPTQAPNGKAFYDPMNLRAQDPTANSSPAEIARMKAMYNNTPALVAGEVAPYVLPTLTGNVADLGMNAYEGVKSLIKRLK